MNQRQQDFIAGFICAGGSAEEAESQAAQFEALHERMEKDGCVRVRSASPAEKFDMARDLLSALHFQARHRGVGRGRDLRHVLEIALTGQSTTSEVAGKDAHCHCHRARR